MDTESIVRRSQNPRGQGGELREQIVVAALRLLEASGNVETLSLRSVAREAGITAPSIYAHFADLDEVVDAAMERMFHDLADHLANRVEGVIDPVERLRVACRAYVDFSTEHPHRYNILFSDSPNRSGAVEENVHTMIGSDAFAFLLDGIGACATVGRSDTDDPRFDATALWVALHGYATLRVSRPNFTWPPTADMVDTLIDRLARVTPTAR